MKEAAGAVDQEVYRGRTGKSPFFTPVGGTRKQEVYPADKAEFLRYMGFL